MVTYAAHTCAPTHPWATLYILISLICFFDICCLADADLHYLRGNLHSSPWEGKLLLEGPYTFQNNYQVPWAFPAIICLCAMTILPL